MVHLGGHNGMKSIVSLLQNDKFPRIRVGIGKPKFEDDVINYVIGSIPKEEIEGLNLGVEKAKESIKEILKNGIDVAMNKFN